MKGMTVIVLMWEEAAIKDDVIEYDIAFNIIYIMRTNIDKGGICCFMVILVLLNNDASKLFQAQLPQQR